MKRRWAVIFACFLAVFQISAAAEMPEQVVAVGQAVGIDVKCSGLLVVGFPEDSPAKESGLHRGDLILQVDGETVTDPAGLRELLQDKSQVTVTARRLGREQSFLVPVEETWGMKMIGANVRTEMAGIGTVTYYDPITSVFGALGHGITDGVTQELFPLRDGFICRAAVVSADRGRVGSPGMLQGEFDTDGVLGTVTKNTESGIFGQMYLPAEGQILPVAERDEIVTGPAEILCNVEGTTVERFAVEIRRIYPSEDETGRNLMLKVTDRRLIDITGGIVQGMSGSPIIQNGKLIGAVTHVLVNSPDTGYGIFIENMLEAAG